MATHKFEPKQFHVTIATREPVLRIKSGDTVETWCVDSGGRDSTGQNITPGGNPQTGPFYVEDAAPGDTLAVTFDKMWPNRVHGYTGGVVAPWTVDSWFVRDLPKPEGDDWEVDVEKGFAKLKVPRAGLETFQELKLDPMLGCFGVAPERGQAISCATSGQHGGNMDYRGFRQGVTVYFPVFVEGALFHLGDGHAIQGDGEIVGTGIEISFDVTFTVRLIKNKKINWPRAENEDSIMAAGNARPLDQALQHATTELLRMLEQDYGLDYRAGSVLLGQCVRYDLGNVFDPAYTMIARVEKKYLPRRKE